MNLKIQDTPIGKLSNRMDWRNNNEKGHASADTIAAHNISVPLKGAGNKTNNNAAKKMPSIALKGVGNKMDIQHAKANMGKTKMKGKGMGM